MTGKNKPTDTYDVVGAVGTGVAKIWLEREYLMRLALFPILMKFFSILSVLNIEEGGLVRSELILLPAYFAEGWMLSHLVRLIFLNQKWPFRPSGDQEKDMAALNDRARGILSGTISYVLIHMVMVLAGVGLRDMMMQQADLENPSMGMHVFAVAVFVLFLWAFRFFWIYIPLAINVPAAAYAKAVAAPKLSFHMLGTWILCYVPFFFVIYFITLPYLVPEETVQISLLQKAGVAWLQAIVESITVLVVTAGMAYGIRELMTGEKNVEDEV
jgi:hypothetical protein